MYGVVVICEKCLSPAPAGDYVPGSACSHCGGRNVGPVAVGAPESRRDDQALISSSLYRWAVADGASEADVDGVLERDGDTWVADVNT